MYYHLCNRFFIFFVGAGGDLGGAVGPALVGAVSGAAGGNLKPGLLAALVFPLLLIGGLYLLKKAVRS